MIVFDIVFGSNNWPCQLVNRDESLPQPGDFIASDVLTATVAPGESLPAIFTPTVTWYQTTGYTTGLTFLSITSAECELLAPNETYTIQIFATRGSDDPVCVWMGNLFVIPAAGSTAPAAVFPAPSGAYAGFSDLEFYAPWLDEVMDTLTDQAGFMNYLMRARTWLDRIIVAPIGLWHTSIISLRRSLHGGRLKRRTISFRATWRRITSWCVMSRWRLFAAGRSTRSPTRW